MVGRSWHEREGRGLQVEKSMMKKGVIEKMGEMRRGMMCVIGGLAVADDVCDWWTGGGGDGGGSCDSCAGWVLVVVLGWS